MKLLLLQEFSTKADHLKGQPPNPQMQAELAAIAEPYLTHLIELGDSKTEALMALRQAFFSRCPLLAKRSFKHLEQLSA